MTPIERVAQEAAELGLPLPRPLLDELEAAYQDGSRHYHDLTHILELLDWLHTVSAGPGWAHPREVLIAALYHDLVYDPLRSDNEARSADRAIERVRQHLSEHALDLAVIRALIEETARHGAHGDGLSDDLQHFVDADMAILGADRARFEAYDRAIQREYAAVPEELFQAGRRRFFQSLLEADRIYLSPLFHRLLDGAARANLQAAL